MPDQPAYYCTYCGQRFSGPYIRCIGSDGKHPPRFPQYKEKKSSDECPCYDGEIHDDEYYEMFPPCEQCKTC